MKDNIIRGLSNDDIDSAKIFPDGVVAETPI